MLLGLLSVACVPAGIAAAHWTSFRLIEAGYAVAPGFLLGALALLAARSARRRTERTIGRIGGERATRLGRILGALGVYLALAGALSLAVYRVLVYLSA